MAYNLTNLTANVNNIQSLSDRPNETDGLTAQGLKERFDKAGIDIKNFLNGTMIEELEKILNELKGYIDEDSIKINENKEAITRIIESGDGYIKYSDGTMICTGSSEVSRAASTTWGGVYATSTLTGFQYAQEFKDIPVVNMSIRCKGNNGWLMALLEGTTTTTPSYQLVRGNSGTVAGTVDYIAIGKWK